MADRRNYSDEERADALAAIDALDGNLSAASRKTNIPRGTLRRWDADRDRAAPAQLRHEKKADLGDRVEDLAHKILDVLPGKLDEASARDLSTSLGIAIDKARLLRGEATNITENRAEGAKDRVRQRIDRIATAQRN